MKKLLTVNNLKVGQTFKKGEVMGRYHSGPDTVTQIAPFDLRVERVNRGDIYYSDTVVVVATKTDAQ